MVPPFGPRERAARRERLLFELTQLHPLVRVEIDVGVLTHRANGRVRPVNGHDELLSRPCLGQAIRARCPLSRAGKEIILTTTRPVGVDAVLSADVGDAPMRQLQYTAAVRAPSHGRRVRCDKRQRRQVPQETIRVAWPARVFRTAPEHASSGITNPRSARRRSGS